MAELKIEQVAISKLKPSAYNPRKWDQSAIDQLTKSIQEFGLVDPILANLAPKRKNIVVGGHFRLKVAKDLGFTEVPVVYLNIPEEVKEKELKKLDIQFIETKKKTFIGLEVCALWLATSRLKKMR